MAKPMKKLLSLGLFLVLFSGIFTGCKKDKGDPPVLPPKESMTIDFSNFVITGKSAGVKGTENSNYEFAATVANIWNLIVNATLVVPVASFKLAIDQTPGYLSKNNWQWSYNVSSGGATYKARLTGEIAGTVVNWKMYISKDGTGSFPEFVWFEGTSKVDGTGGQWILNQSAASPTPLLQIDWTKSGSSLGTIKYTFVKNSDAFKTSSIEYGLTGNALNAYYTIHYYNGAKFSDVNVEWNTSTHNGRVKCLDYLGTTSWYCWDANKINTVCN
jgi:hypothetical protein